LLFRNSSQRSWRLRAFRLFIHSHSYRDEFSPNDGLSRNTGCRDATGRSCAGCPKFSLDFSRLCNKQGLSGESERQCGMQGASGKASLQFGKTRLHEAVHVRQTPFKQAIRCGWAFMKLLIARASRGHVATERLAGNPQKAHRNLAEPQQNRADAGRASIDAHPAPKKTQLRCNNDLEVGEVVTLSWPLTIVTLLAASSTATRLLRLRSGCRWAAAGTRPSHKGRLLRRPLR
jgi:hypothetical protein